MLGLGAHLFCGIIVFWLSWLVEIQHSVGAQADGADSRVVQWSVLMGLESGHQGWAGRECTSHPLGQSGAPKLGQGDECWVGLSGCSMSVRWVCMMPCSLIVERSGRSWLLWLG